MPMDRIQSVVIEIAAEFSRLSPEQLTPATTFGDLKLDDESFDELIEECCERLCIASDTLFETMPPYDLEVHAVVMLSLQRWAMFSRRAMLLLEKLNPRVEMPTLESIAESLRQQRYIPSGKYGSQMFPAYKRKKWLLDNAVGVTAIIGLTWLAVVMKPCNSVCQDCTLSAFDKFLLLFPIVVCMLVLFNVAALLPGALFLLSKRSRKLLDR